jgi:hypothetical protein
MQYVPSIRLVQITAERAKLLLGTCHIKGRERLFDIGRIIATDTFLNFSDRLPAIWEEKPKTDIETLLVGYDPEKVPMVELLDDKDNPNIELLDMYAVTTRASCFKKYNKVSKMNEVTYLNKLEKFLEAIFMDLKVLAEGNIDLKSYSFESVAVIRNYLNATLVYDITSLGCLEIIFGLVTGYFNIVAMGLKRLERMHYKVQSLPLKENKAVWLERLAETIDMRSLKETHDLIAYQLQLNVDAVTWVLKMTNNMKAIDVFDDEDEEEEKMQLEIDETYDLEAKQRREDELLKQKLLAEEEAERVRQEEDMKRRAELMLATPRSQNVREEELVRAEGLEQARADEEFAYEPVPEAAPEEVAEEIREQPADPPPDAQPPPEREKQSSCCTLF